MIFGNIHNSGLENTYPAPVRRALAHLKSKDFLASEAGVYDLEGKDIYVQVIDAQTDLKENKRPEIHQKYVDLQFSPAGNEQIGVTTDTGKFPVAEELYAERDILFYKEVTNETFLKMVAGSFAVFFPWDVHRPTCADGAPAKIRKVVIKIKLSLFE